MHELDLLAAFGPFSSAGALILSRATCAEVPTPSGTCRARDATCEVMRPWGTCASIVLRAGISADPRVQMRQLLDIATKLGRPPTYGSHRAPVHESVWTWASTFPGCGVQAVLYCDERTWRRIVVRLAGPYGDDLVLNDEVDFVTVIGAILRVPGARLPEGSTSP